MRTSADIRTHPCGRPQTSAPIHADIRIDVHKDVHIDVRRRLQTPLWTTADLHMEILRTSTQKKFPACVDLQTKHSNTLQTSAGKCPQFSMRNIAFFADISGTGIVYGYSNNLRVLQFALLLIFFFFFFFFGFAMVLLELIISSINNNYNNNQLEDQWS